MYFDRIDPYVGYFTTLSILKTIGNVGGIKSMTFILFFSFDFCGRLNDNKMFTILITNCFLTYINDLAEDLERNPKLFSDDISLNGHIKNTEVSTNCINRDLDTIDLWGKCST